ncbi:MAG: DUF853 domain-containing protein, partial [Alphaproteobacteria bacterium]|nr:DUF853 domain-containing protein [Alphaproteobacteria bacterium]
MSTAPIKQDNSFYVAGVGAAFLFMVGPISALVAGIIFVVGLVLQLRLAASLLIAGVGFLVDCWLNGLQSWLVEPIQFMATVYRNVVVPYLFHGLDGAVVGDYFGKLMVDVPAWMAFGPLGMTIGGLALLARGVMLGGPVRSTASGRPRLRDRVSWFAGLAKKRADRGEAATPVGSLLGIDKMSGRQVVLSDREANTHTLMLGTTGSGKTVTVLNMVESAIDRGLPVIYVDGKGDQALAESVVDYAWSRGRPAYLFSLAGPSCRYNPLSSGGYSAKKDRIIELRDWSEDHYRKLA